MAKPPRNTRSAPVTASTAVKPAIARQALERINTALGEIGLVEGTLTIKDGKQSLKGKTSDGRAVNVVVQDSGSGFREQTVSICEVLTIKARRFEARRLRKEGLTQTAIAAKLGVSQKTISDDLNS